MLGRLAALEVNAPTIRYYAKARNPRGKIEQLLVTKVPGQPTSQQWTGTVYRNDREADADLLALNTSRAAGR